MTPRPASTGDIGGLTDTAVLAAVRRQHAISGGRLVRWRAEPIWAPRLASTAGVYRIDSEVECRRETVSSSLVLKVVSRPVADQLPLEAALYASGALDDLPAGISAPRWHGNVVLGTDRVGIWLDVIRDDVGPWDIERLGIAARHLGRLAGSSVPRLLGLAGERPVRSFWTDSRYLTRTVDSFLAAPSSDLGIRAWPEETRRALGSLWQRRDAVLRRAAWLPLTFCHGDAQRRNFFARRGPTNDTTVAIDWANLARAPIGMDPATLVHYAVAYFDVDAGDITMLERAVLDGYARGMGDQGCIVDIDAIRFGYATQLVFGLGLLETAPILRLVTDVSSHATAERFYGRPLVDILDRRAALAAYLLKVGDELIDRAGRARPVVPGDLS